MHLNYWQFWALITPIALAIGIISSAVVIRILRDPPEAIRSCDDCGSQLSRNDGSHCPHCVTRRRHTLQERDDYVSGLD